MPCAPEGAQPGSPGPPGFPTTVQDAEPSAQGPEQDSTMGLGPLVASSPHPPLKPVRHTPGHMPGENRARNELHCGDHTSPPPCWVLTGITEELSLSAHHSALRLLTPLLCHHCCPPSGTHTLGFSGATPRSCPSHLLSSPRPAPQAVPIGPPRPGRGAGRSRPPPWGPHTPS